MAFTSNDQNIEKLNGNHFHTWKMKIKFVLHHKHLWEINCCHHRLSLEKLFLKELKVLVNIADLIEEKTNWLVGQ
jgi:hypothetical protein